MRQKNKYNIIVSLFSQVIILTLGLIIPRLYLTNYGSDVNGLISTVTQIFTYMALLEAGIGQATKNALYPYIHDDNKDKGKISEVMSISKRYYEKVSIIYIVAVIFLSLTLPFILKTRISYLEVSLIILFEGAGGAISFFFVEKYNMLLAADGKSYVSTNIEFANKLLTYGIKIFFALSGMSVVLIQAGFCIASLLKMLVYKVYMQKKYAWVNYNVRSQEELKDRNAYIITEIAWTIFSSTDMIVLSVFCSTELASVYSVYNMVFVALNSLLSALYNSLVFNLGQNYHKNIEQYKKSHDLFNSIFVGLMTMLMCVAYVLIIPFVKLYTNEVTDINYIYATLPLMFCLVQIISWSRYVAGNLSGVAGYAKRVSSISLIEAIVNITLSVILVNSYGVVGVITATVIALPIKVIYLNYLADKIILNRSAKNTIMILAGNWALFSIAVLIEKIGIIQIDGYLEFMMAGIVYTSVFGSAMIIVNCIVNREFRCFINSILNKCKRQFLFYR